MLQQRVAAEGMAITKDPAVLNTARLTISNKITLPLAVGRTTLLNRLVTGKELHPRATVTITARLFRQTILLVTHLRGFTLSPASPTNRHIPTNPLVLHMELPTVKRLMSMLNNLFSHGAIKLNHFLTILVAADVADIRVIEVVLYAVLILLHITNQLPSSSRRTATPQPLPHHIPAHHSLIMDLVEDMVVVVTLTRTEEL